MVSPFYIWILRLRSFLVTLGPISESIFYGHTVLQPPCLIEWGRLDQFPWNLRIKLLNAKHLV